MAIVYPTLNGNGYARDIGTICDEVFAATIYSRTRYSELYYGKVASLDTLMKDYNNKPELLAEAVEKMYTDLFTRVFGDYGNAQATCSVEEDSNTGICTIVLEITGKYNGVNFNVGHEVQSRNGAFVKTIKRTNGDD